MRPFFKKLLKPWGCRELFDGKSDFFAFLKRRNRILNGVRVGLFVIAAVCLLLFYNVDHPALRYAAAGVLALAAGITLIIVQNEKQFSEE